MPSTHCPARHGRIGQCQHTAGHLGHHQARNGQTWYCTTTEREANQQRRTQIAAAAATDSELLDAHDDAHDAMVAAGERGAGPEHDRLSVVVDTMRAELERRNLID